MQIETVVTKAHKVVFSADDLKSVCINAAKANLGLGSTATYSDPEATIGDDGSITISVVESVPAAATDAGAASSDDASATKPAAAAPVASGMVIPTV